MIFTPFNVSLYTARLDRYNHELEEDSEEGGEGGVFPSFSSYSPRYHKITSSHSADVPQLDTSFQVISVPCIVTCDL